MPSLILVVASWISFFIPVDLVPGRYVNYNLNPAFLQSIAMCRMALLVTILLMMINFTTNVSKDSPTTNEFSSLDLWLLGIN